MSMKYEIKGQSGSVCGVVFAKTDSAKQAVVILRAAKKLNFGKVQVVGFTELELDKQALKEV